MTAMSMDRQPAPGRLIRLALAGSFCVVASAASVSGTDTAIGFERTPPRLSMVEGVASFWRPGADDWTEVQVNTPLAAGDQLYTALATNLEVQVGPRAFLRAGEKTQFGLEALEPDYLQVRISEGGIALDLRELRLGHTIEVSTPHAAITVERPGFYRVAVDDGGSTFTSRRGGNAAVTPLAGQPVTLSNGEQIAVGGGEIARVETRAAPEIDGWDRWNYARSDRQINAASARYVSADIYGLADLDEHGDWRQVPDYGPVWVPRRVAVDWVPYSTGRWLHDPFYGWSWVDYSPWGWAPFHYGRWVHVSGFWGWCPGPVVVRPFYAPALVAFFGAGRGVAVSVSVGAPFGWVALGWGEPLVPWWGPVHFRGAPWWGGWGGPRYVNRVFVNNNTVININNINVYDNTRVRGGVVVVDRDSFGRRRVDSERRRDFDPQRLRPVRGELPFRPSAESLRPGDRPGRRPPGGLVDRRVVSTRERRSGHPGTAAAPPTDDLAGVRQRRHGDSVGQDRRAAALTQDRRGAAVGPETRLDGATERRGNYAVDQRRRGAAVSDDRRTRRADAPAGDRNSAPPANVRQDRRGGERPAAGAGDRFVQPPTGERQRYAAAERPAIGTRRGAGRGAPPPTDAGRRAPSREDRLASPGGGRTIDSRRGFSREARPVPPPLPDRNVTERRRAAPSANSGIRSLPPRADTITRNQPRRSADVARGREMAGVDRQRLAPPPPPPPPPPPASVTGLGGTTRRDPAGRGATANRDAMRSGQLQAQRQLGSRPPVASGAARVATDRPSVSVPREARGAAPYGGGGNTASPRQREMRSHVAERRAAAPRPSGGSAPAARMPNSSIADARGAMRSSAQLQRSAPQRSTYSAASGRSSAPAMRGGGSASMRGGGSPAMRGGGSGMPAGGAVRGAPRAGGDGRRGR